MKFTALPFVVLAPNGAVTSNWAVTPTGDHQKDCHTGRQYFGLLNAVMRREDNPALLGRVLEGQVQAGRWTGIEIGFAAAAAEAAME